MRESRGSWSAKVLKTILTFIIPVRHQDNAPNWPEHKRRLAETIRSIAAQDRDGWKAVIVANEGADLPALPKGFDVKRVGYPPNRFSDRRAGDLEGYRDAFRLDKGRRVLAGMMHAGEMGHAMIVDDDDLVNRNLTSFVAANQEANGWYIESGYVWSDGGKFLYRYEDFSTLCGSSLIIRAHLRPLPASEQAADEVFLRRALGSHVLIRNDLARAGFALAPLPFPGAVYRVGHRGAWSRSKGMFRLFFLNRHMLRTPLEMMRRTRRLRLRSRRLDETFFGRNAIAE